MKCFKYHKFLNNHERLIAAGFYAIIIDLFWSIGDSIHILIDYGFIYFLTNKWYLVVVILGLSLATYYTAKAWIVHYDLSIKSFRAKKNVVEE